MDKFVNKKRTYEEIDLENQSPKVSRSKNNNNNNNSNSIPESTPKKSFITSNRMQLIPSNGKTGTGWVLFVKAMMKKKESDVYFQTFEDKIDWKERKVTLFGKEMMQPRLVSFSSTS